MSPQTRWIDELPAPQQKQAREILEKWGLDPDDPDVRAALSESCDYPEFARRAAELIELKGQPTKREAWVFMIHRIRGRWFLSVELHVECKPRHVGCEVLERSNPAGGPRREGFATEQAARRWLKAWLEENLPGAECVPVVKA